ncbi:hypothetical protein GVAV_003134 [Gurleya vavrai]
MHNDHDKIKRIKKDAINISCEVYQKLYALYQNESLGRFYLVRDRNCCSECLNIIDELQNDIDVKTRAEANKIGSFCHSRILDTSREVRKVIFDRILNEKIFDKETLLILFQGGKTKFKEEYFDLIDKIKLNFNFLYDNRNRDIKTYLKSRLFKKDNTKIDKQNNKKQITKKSLVLALVKLDWTKVSKKLILHLILR